MLNKAVVTFDQLDAYACNVGPGSFTGIRIGAATLKGYMMAAPKKLIAFDSLYMLTEGKGKAIIDAGNGYYYAKYRFKKAVAKPQLIAYNDRRAKNAKQFTNVDEHISKLLKVVRSLYKKGAFADQLSPIYIRRSQAEDNLAKNS